MTITIDPTEFEHLLIFATSVALLAAICFIAHLTQKNIK
jgi:hypothetical protein